MFHKNGEEKGKRFSNIKEIVNAQDWKYLVKNSLPVNIADTYSFREAMHIIDNLMDASANQMNEDAFTADLMRDYSVNLMKILRAKYRHDWEKDWKNEAYLGLTCGLIFREEEAFEHIENAFKQLVDPPQSLILAYISAGTGSDHFLKKEEIARLSQIAIEKGVTYESALRMSALAYEQHDFENQKHWKTLAIEAEKKGVHTPVIIPNVLKDTFKREGGRDCEK